MPGQDNCCHFGGRADGILPASCGESSEAEKCYREYAPVYASVAVQVSVNERQKRKHSRDKRKRLMINLMCKE